jgi:hypothetical protein
VTAISYATLDQALWSRVEKTDGCWLWGGAKSFGYGQLTFRRKGYKAHRLAYELLVGPIPDGLQIDHLCRVRNCVNPEHLEPVTQLENQRRTQPYRNRWVPFEPGRTCRKGHPWTRENVLVWVGGKRGCRTCKRINSAKHKSKAKAAQA